MPADPPTADLLAAYRALLAWGEAILAAERGEVGGYPAFKRAAALAKRFALADSLAARAGEHAERAPAAPPKGCAHCDGSGVQRVAKHMHGPYRPMTLVEQPCPACGGAKGVG